MHCIILQNLFVDRRQLRDGLGDGRSVYTAVCCIGLVYSGGSEQIHHNREPEEVAVRAAQTWSARQRRK